MYTWSLAVVIEREGDYEVSVSLFPMLFPHLQGGIFLNCDRTLVLGICMKTRLIRLLKHNSTYLSSTSAFRLDL